MQFSDNKAARNLLLVFSTSFLIGNYTMRFIITDKKAQFEGLFTSRSLIRNTDNPEHIYLAIPSHYKIGQQQNIPTKCNLPSFECCYLN